MYVHGFIKKYFSEKLTVYKFRSCTFLGKFDSRTLNRYVSISNILNSADFGMSIFRACLHSFLCVAFVLEYELANGMLGQSADLLCGFFDNHFTLLISSEQKW